MGESTGVKPTPVVPAVVQVPDLAAACAFLGLPAPPEGTHTIEFELLPGCTVAMAEADGDGTHFAYLCVAELDQARRHIEREFGAAKWGPDSVDPETYRLRGRILGGGGLIIDAVQCHAAGDNGIPCSDACSPFLSFL